MDRLRHLLACLAVVAAAGPVHGGPAEDALIAAIKAADLVATKAALAAGADPDRQVPPAMLTGLSVAVARGNSDLVETLLNAGADPDAQNLMGSTALSVALRSCRTDRAMVALLIAAGADIENRSGAGLTPLLVAVQEGRDDLAHLLLDAGADANALNPFGEGILNYAIYMKNPAMIQAAMDHHVKTDQLRKLFTTVDYDPPGYLDSGSHFAELCQGKTEG